MEKLMDVYGLQTIYGQELNFDEGWIGKILINSDYTFEGIVRDNFTYELDYVFGKVNKEGNGVEIVDLIKSKKEDERLPFRYIVQKENNKYFGDFFVRTQTEEFLCGEARISLIEAEKTREVSFDEVRTLKEKILEAKSKIGPETQAIYEEFNQKNPKKIKLSLYN